MNYIDLRSDTVTWPTDEMREAMAKAPVGDDVYGDDPTVRELELYAASLAGKEAALFVPSGTFGNQLALFTHCPRGSEVILDDQCHIVQHEAGASSVIAGVQLRTVDCEGKSLNVIWADLENESAVVQSRDLREDGDHIYVDVMFVDGSGLRVLHPAGIARPGHGLVEALTP